jgi:hypothetical protein
MREVKTTTTNGLQRRCASSRSTTFGLSDVERGDRAQQRRCTPGERSQHLQVAVHPPKTAGKLTPSVNMQQRSPPAANGKRGK